jgi:DNA-binding transcriptional LysR family regulator
MHVSLEQARALDALARHGTFVAAAKALHKGHTAVLYAVQSLERQTGLTLLDRRGYRTRLSAEGERVLVHCRRLLEVEQELRAACAQMKTGWEPTLRIVFDGIYPAEPLLRTVGTLRARGANTRFHISAEFLTGVEEAFEREGAQLMVSLLPPRSGGLTGLRLPELRALLVAHREHPLTRSRRKKPLCEEDLAAHLVLTVRGSDPRLQMSTGALEEHSTVYLNSFAAKKEAILQGLGFGWLPEHLITRELRSRELKVLPLEQGAVHTFHPRLYHRAGAPLGPAAAGVVEALTNTLPSPPGRGSG